MQRQAASGGIEGAVEDDRFEEIRALILSKYAVNEVTTPADISKETGTPVPEVIQTVQIMVGRGDMCVQLDGEDAGGDPADQVQESG
jgi:hypothetical protein